MTKLALASPALYKDRCARLLQSSHQHLSTAAASRSQEGRGALQLSTDLLLASSSKHRYPYCFRSWFVMRVHSALSNRRALPLQIFLFLYSFFFELVMDLESQVCRVILVWRCDRTARHRCCFALSYSEESAGFNAGWPMLMALQFGFSVTFFLFFKKKQVLIFERAVKNLQLPISWRIVVKKNLSTKSSTVRIYERLNSHELHIN